MTEAGLPGYNSTTWFGIVAPAGIDPAIVKRLNGYLQDMIKDPEVQKKLDASYLEPMSMSSEAFATLIRDDLAKWKAIVEAAGVRLE